MFLMLLILKFMNLKTSLVDYLDNILKTQLISVIKKKIYFLIQKCQHLKIFQKLVMKDLNLFILKLLRKKFTYE